MTEVKIDAVRAAARERRRRTAERRRETAPLAHTLLPHGTHVHGSRPPFWERQWLATYEVLLAGSGTSPRKRRRPERSRKA